jgi:ADP-ribose pyrophosphatase YjhB (NUDIX family)
MLPLIFSCGAVVYKKGPNGSQILLIKQFAKDDAWGIPKGHMERGETYTETAIREVKEETGIDIKIITQLPHVSIIRKKSKKIVVPFLAIQTCVNEPRSDSSEASEVIAAQWFSIGSLPSIYHYQQPIIDAALILLEMRK